MAQMAAAARAQHLGPHHAVGPVARLVDGVLLRREERGPAAAGVVLGLGAEELRAAPGAAVRSRIEAVVVLAGEGALRPLLPQDAVLVGRERGAPLRVGSHDLRHQLSVTAGSRTYRRGQAPPAFADVDAVGRI